MVAVKNDNDFLLEAWRSAKALTLWEALDTVYAALPDTARDDVLELVRTLSHTVAHDAALLRVVDAWYTRTITRE